MANSFLALPAPAGNASGAQIDVSTLGATKTIVVEGNGSGFYEPYVQIEVSNDNAFQIWTPLYRFLRPGSITITNACRYMRATTQNYVQGGAPTVNVGAEDTGATFFELVAPAGNGFGASVDVSAFPALKTFQVSGTFKGNLSVQISNDGGTTWSQADGLSFRNKGGMVTIVIIAQFMRLARSGIQAREPNPGLPICDVGAAVEAGSGGGITGSGTANTMTKWTGASTIGDSSVLDDGSLVSTVIPVAVQQLRFTPAISPAALAAGATQNYAPTGLATTTDLRVTPDAGGTSSLGGMVGNQTGGALVVITNIGAALLTISHEAGGSTAANRFSNPGAVDIVLRAGASLICLYDFASLRWRPVGEAFGGFPYLNQLYVLGNVTMDGLTRLYQTIQTGYMALNGSITPAALAAGDNDNVDYSPGILSAQRIRQAANVAGSNLTGIVPIGIGGATFQLINLGPGTLTIPDQDAGSAAANQFLTEGGVADVIAINGWRWITYDATLTKWLVH